MIILGVSKCGGTALINRSCYDDGFYLGRPLASPPTGAVPDATVSRNPFWAPPRRWAAITTVVRANLCLLCNLLIIDQCPVGQMRAHGPAFPDVRGTAISAGRTNCTDGDVLF
ncbi:hypothetical protein GWI33_021963 [Rhynchophorus ferrugineus]|uniref:Uncharacterized protein n=1 Tax=Rhynchophorus ferrugineus TaxID=354439 RepID=A0A834IT61_RHYFE|nr:hypothetical protein GWI33_021963 [Rhynchophorus ferrugineus]